MWALVPLKSLDQAKQRLANTLSSSERRDLMLAMVRDVLTSLKQAQRIIGILIISRTPEADALAASFSTERFAESEGGDLSQALTEGARYATEVLGAEGIMIIPADVPLLTAAEIDQMLTAHQQVSIVPDADEVGTNCLVCTPMDAIEYQFDGQSFKPHCAGALARGITPNIFASPGFGLDIDTPKDLKELLATPSQGRPPCQTVTFLDKSGIADRL